MSMSQFYEGLKKKILSCLQSYLDYQFLCTSDFFRNGGSLRKNVYFFELFKKLFPMSKTKY